MYMHGILQNENIWLTDKYTLMHDLKPCAVFEMNLNVELIASEIDETINRVLSTPHLN